MLTLEVAAVASILVVGSHMMGQMAEACWMHSWVVRMFVVEEPVGLGLRRRRAQVRRRLLLV